VNQYYLVLFLISDLKQNKRNDKQKGGSKVGLSGGNGGNCTGPHAGKGPPVMKFICFR